MGPRQSGKTTLARRFEKVDFPYFTLDDPVLKQVARDDPIGFLRGNDRMIIDEIQRAPELILPIKKEVDQDSRPGRFLLTGSANWLTLPSVTDSLAGRMGIFTLLPLAQAELHNNPNSFLDSIFSGILPSQACRTVLGQELVELVLSGGYPEAIPRTNWRRRQAWHRDHLNLVLHRDVQDMARLERRMEIPQLIHILAVHSGQLVNYSALGGILGMNHVTTRKYIAVLENLFLICTLNAWYTNQIKRATKTRKLHFLDAGLHASLLNLTPDSFKGPDRTAFGPILESFILSELLKISHWSEGHYRFSHFRDKERREVDFVIENAHGQIVGIEVKASATVNSKDFAGLRLLEKSLGHKFLLGIVLYDNEYVASFGDKMIAAPISTLWR